MAGSRINHRGTSSHEPFILQALPLKICDQAQARLSMVRFWQAQRQSLLRAFEQCTCWTCCGFPVVRRASHCWSCERPPARGRSEDLVPRFLAAHPVSSRTFHPRSQSTAPGLPRSGQWSLWLPPTASRCRRARPAPTCQAGNTSGRRQRP